MKLAPFRKERKALKVFLAENANEAQSLPIRAHFRGEKIITPIRLRLRLRLRCLIALTSVGAAKRAAAKIREACGLAVATGNAAAVDQSYKKKRSAAGGAAIMRESSDEIQDGFVWNGFDYALQVWVGDGVIMPCAHPNRMRSSEETCCPAYHLAGRLITEVEGAERRQPAPAIGENY